MVREKSRHARHLSEFELIERFFTHRARAQPERAAAIDNAEAPPRRPLKTALGIGDDCALINDTDDANSRFQPICWLKGVIFSQTSIRARWAIKRSRSICPIWPQWARRRAHLPSRLRCRRRAKTGSRRFPKACSRSPINTDAN